MKLQALVITADPEILEIFAGLVRPHGFETRVVRSSEQAAGELEKAAPDLAVLDLDLTDDDGEELLEALQVGFETEVIVVSGEGSIDSAVNALKSGASEYLTKPLDVERLERAVLAAKRSLGLRRQIVELRANLRRLGRFGRLVGASPGMQAVYDLVLKVGPTSSTVLVTGETGTGKELVAHAVHRMSRRADGPFVAVNCGAIQPTLIESELFGHEPGSFTGARKTRKGLFEQAQGGTLFLDEVTEMPADLQVKLLRVLETKAIRRVGGEKAIPIDARLVAATNRAPDEAVADGTLREDLFYRLQVFPIQLPPLRERADDIELLAEYFLDELNEQSGETKRFEAVALQKLAEHPWPGNVRELRNVVERAYILADDKIMAKHIRIFTSVETQAAAAGRVVTVEVGSSIAEAERQLVLATLDELVGDKKKAAKVLGISLKTLYNRLNSYG